MEEEELSNEDKSSFIEFARVNMRKSSKKDSRDGHLQETVVPHKPLRTPRKQFSDTVRKTSHEGTPKKMARRYVRNDRLDGLPDETVVPLKLQEESKAQGTDNDSFRASMRRYFKKVPSDDSPDEKAVNYRSSLDLRNLLRDNEKTASSTDTSKEGTRKRPMRDSRNRPSEEKGGSRGTSQSPKKPVIERKKISPPGITGEHAKKLSPIKNSREQPRRNSKKGLSDGHRMGTWVSSSPPRGSRKQRGDPDFSKETTRRDRKKDVKRGSSDEKVFPLSPVMEMAKRTWNPEQHLYTLLGIDSTEELLADPNTKMNCTTDPADEVWGSEQHEHVLLSTKSTEDLAIQESNDDHVEINRKELSGSEKLLHTLLGSKSTEGLPRAGSLIKEEGTTEGLMVSADSMEDNMRKVSTPEQSPLNVLVSNNTDKLSQSPGTNSDVEAEQKEVWGHEEHTSAFLGTDITGRLSTSVDITMDEDTNWKEVWNHNKNAPILLDTDSIDDLFESEEFNAEEEWDPEQWIPTLLGTESTEKLFKSLDMSRDEEMAMRKEVWDPEHCTPPFCSSGSIEELFQSPDLSADEETRREEVWCPDKDPSTVLDTDGALRMSKSPGICDDEETKVTEAVQSEDVFPYMLGYEVAQELTKILVRNADCQQTEANQSTGQPGLMEETPVKGPDQFLATLCRMDTNIGDTKREEPEASTENLAGGDDLPLSWGEFADVLLHENVAKEWRNKSRSMRRNLMRVKKKKISEKTRPLPLDFKDKTQEDIKEDEKEPVVCIEDKAELTPEASRPEEEAVAVVSQGEQVLEEEMPRATSFGLSSLRPSNFISAIRALLRRISVRDWLANRAICWPHGGTRRVSPM